MPHDNSSSGSQEGDSPALRPRSDSNSTSDDVAGKFNPLEGASASTLGTKAETETTFSIKNYVVASGPRLLNPDDAVPRSLLGLSAADLIPQLGRSLTSGPLDIEAWLRRVNLQSPGKPPKNGREKNSKEGDGDKRGEGSDEPH